MRDIAQIGPPESVSFLKSSWRLTLIIPEWEVETGDLWCSLFICPSLYGEFLTCKKLCLKKKRRNKEKKGKERK